MQIPKELEHLAYKPSPSDKHVVSFLMGMMFGTLFSQLFILMFHTVVQCVRTGCG